MKILKQINRLLGHVDESQFPPLGYYVRFPSSGPGILPYSIDKVLARNEEVIDRIRQSAKCGDEHYKKYYLPLIYRYASYVHLLPASQNNHHREAGGLLSHGLEVAQHSLELLSSDRFQEELSKAEKDNCEAKAILFLGCFVAALAHDFPKILSDMTISTDGQKQTYRLFESSLVDWLLTNEIPYYQVQFKPDRHNCHKSLIHAALDTLLPENIRSYLVSGGYDLSVDVMGGIDDLKNNMISKCVREGDKISVKHYMVNNGYAGSPSPALNTGMAPHDHLVLAINRMFSDGHWEVNAPGGVAKLINNHLYLVWPRAGAELLANYSVTGITHDPDAVAQVLQEWGIIDVGALETPYWFIGSGDVSLKTVRLVKASRWLMLLRAPVSNHSSLVVTEQQQLASANTVLAFPCASNDSVVQNFLQLLASPKPSFPVQAFNHSLYARKEDVEKWFIGNGVSQSQLLRFVRDGQLGLVKIKIGSREEKMIGPPS